MNKQPYILWLVSWYPTRLDPFPGDFIQRHAQALSHYCPVHVLHIARDEDGTLTKDILIEDNNNGRLRETIIYYHVPKTGLTVFDKPVSMRTFLKAGKKYLTPIIESQRPVLLHVHVAVRHGLLALWAKKQYKIPYVVTEHWTGYTSTYPDHLKPGPWFWAAARKIYRQADYFYPVTDALGKSVSRHFKNINYRPLSNCVDTRYFHQPQTTPHASSAFHFIHVSTLSHQKNIEGLLAVAERIFIQYAGVYLTLIGPAPAAVTQRINASATLAGRIKLTGAITYAQVAATMQDADALLMFSRHENQPCVILEALCCGLPVIATNVGGISEVVDESNGLLVANEDENALYKAMETMLLRERTYNRTAIANDATSKYNYETIGKQLLDYYQQDLPGCFY